MLAQRCGPFLMIMLAAIFLNYVHGDCKINRKGGAPEFPDPKKLYEKGDQYELKVEVNDIQKMWSMYATEYFVSFNKKGRVDSHFNGAQRTFLYHTETGEGFIFGNDPECESANISENVKPHYQDFNVYDWKYLDGTVLKFGPFSMLSKGYAEKNKMEYEGVTQVRGLPANVWKRCAEGNNVTIRYMLIDEGSSREISGISNLPIPLRITVDGTLDKTKINQSYEFVHFQENIEDASTVLAIPFNKGCKRLVESENKVEYRDYNFAYEAEIVYTETLLKDKKIYINNLKAIYDNTSGLFAYTTIPWIAHKDSTLPNPGDELFRVFDVKNGYLYEVDLDKSSCNISAKTPEETGANLLLPSGDKVSLLNPEIITLNNDTAAGYKYLGEGTDRGKKVNVFEKTWGEIEAKYISTRYYLAEGQEEISDIQEKNPLMKVVYTEYFANTPTMELVFNFYHYNTLLTHKPKSFDVSSCFKEENQTEWFQIVFPLSGTDYKMKELEDAFLTIEDNFFTTLMVDKIVTPVRIPRIMVDADKDFLYITAALLERVPAKLDFQFESNVRLSTEANVVGRGITTEESCYQACIETIKCRAINYCGVNCELLMEVYTPAMGTDDKSCMLYKRVKTITQLTTKQVNEKMTERMSTGDFKLEFKYGGHLQTLRDPEFRQGVAFGLNNYNSDSGTKKIDSMFSIYKQGYNIKRADSVSTHSFAECQQECLSDLKACESFSFCEVTSSCSFSKSYGADLDVTNLAKDDMCFILTRNYLYTFVLYEGVSMTSGKEITLAYNDPEHCAKACIDSQEIQCRSFDLCDGPGKRTCLLHPTHVIDTKGDTVQASNCAHYSRNYVFDFIKVEKGKALMEDAIREKIINLKSVEECAKICVDNSDCKAFDFCQKPFTLESQCFISHTVPSKDKIRDGQYCSLYSRPDEKTANMLSPVKMETVEHVHHSEKMMADDDGKEKDENALEIIEDTGYSKSLTGGIAFFLFLVGIAVGAAAMFGYGYYKANRRI